MEQGQVLMDIGSCKQTMLSMFLNNLDICSLLLNKKNYTEDEQKDLRYTQIFPYLYVGDTGNETQTEVLSYLCFDVDVPRCSSATIKDIKIIVWCYCHKDIMKYSKKGYYGTRADILADMVERQLRDSYDFGIGKPELISATCFYPNTGYYGRKLIYNVPEFMVKGR